MEDKRESDGRGMMEEEQKIRRLEGLKMGDGRGARDDGRWRTKGKAMEEG